MLVALSQMLKPGPDPHTPSLGGLTWAQDPVTFRGAPGETSRPCQPAPTVHLPEGASCL